MYFIGVLDASIAPFKNLFYNFKVKVCNDLNFWTFKVTETFEVIDFSIKNFAFVIMELTQYVHATQSCFSIQVKNICYSVAALQEKSTTNIGKICKPTEHQITLVNLVDMEILGLQLMGFDWTIFLMTFIFGSLAGITLYISTLLQRNALFSFFDIDGSK